MWISKIVMTILAIFFAAGAIDSMLGNRFGLGEPFLKAFRMMGSLALGILGLYSLAPAAAQGIGTLVQPLAQATGIDPSAFPALIFPVDLGGFTIATAIAHDAQMGLFFGAVAASIFGATVGYNIPLASGLVKPEHNAELALGMLCGLITTPVGIYLAGILTGLPALALAINMLPMALLGGILCVALLRAPTTTARLFAKFGRLMNILGTAGIVLQMLRTLTGWDPIPAMAPLPQSMSLIATITFSVTGGMMLLHVVQRYLPRQLDSLGKRVGLDGKSISGLLISTVTTLVVYSSYDEYPSRGRVLCAAFGASGAFLLGGQMSVVSTLAPDMIPAYFLAKGISGVLAVSLAVLLYKRETRRIAQRG